MAIRCDRYDLAPRRQLDDGSWVYEAVLARADVALQYSWGQEVATAEALSDPEYLEALRGLMLTVRHPDAKRVDISDPSTYREGGTVLGARWDESARHVAIEVVVKDAQAIDAIQSGQTGVSEGYAVPHLDATSEPSRQMKRVPNHVALTMDAPPRMPGAHIRRDHPHTESGMLTLEQITTLLQSKGLRVDSIDALTESINEIQHERMATAVAEVRAWEGAFPGEGTPAARRERMDAMVADRVAQLTALHKRAVELGKDLDASLRLDDARTALAVELGGDPEKSKAADYAQAVIDLAQKPETRADSFSNRTTTRQVETLDHGC